MIIKTDFDNRFKVTAKQLEAAITPHTRLVVLNSPSNPTGIAYTRAELAEIGEVLLNHPDILIMSDDIYEHTLWVKEPFCNILMACPELYDRCIVINGVSKAYAMTGWRIGYAAGPEKIIKAMCKIQSQSTSNATSIAQAAAEAALSGKQDFIATMVKAFKERHDFVLSSLQKMPGVKCLPSDGTFYIFPSVEELIHASPEINNDIEFCEYLLNIAEIALVPGSAFGAPGFVRISYATSMEKLQDAMQRMTKAVQQLNSTQPLAP